MNAATRTVAKRSRIGDAGGYTLIEMMVAIAISVIIGAGIYAVFNAQQRSSRAQKTYNDLQTSCTFALDTIKNDLLLAGYRAKNPLEPISVANNSDITFEFLNDRAYDDVSYYGSSLYDKETQVEYRLQPVSASDPAYPNKLVKTTRRWHPSNPATVKYDTPLAQTLAENITSLSFQYLKQDNTQWSAADGLSKIRSVRVSLVCRGAQENAIFKNPSLPAGAPKYQSITLTTEVRPRNVALATTPEDEDPPAPPTDVKVWDSGRCGCLNMSWAANTDPDIAAYVVYYGLASGDYVGRVRVDHQSGVTPQTYTLQNLSATNAEYFIKVAAVDKSGNQSSLSTPEIHNKLVLTTTSSYTDAGNDTAITPNTVPPPPGVPSPAYATPADNQLKIRWTPTYSDCMTTPNFGYRVFRSTNPSFLPEGADKGLGNCIADEKVTPILGPTSVDLLDKGLDTPQGQLVGCVPYTYKIAVVNCDPAQLTNLTDRDPATPTSYTDAVFATITGTPTDEGKPPAPTLLSTPGYRRIILRLTNPVRDAGQTPDFLHTKIFFSTAGATFTISEDRDAEGFNIVRDEAGVVARPIPDFGGKIADAGGVIRINFDSETREIPLGGINKPELPETTTTYYFVAIAYDICKNHSAITTQATTQAEQCNDCLSTETCYNKPPPPLNIRVTEGCNDSPLRLEWDYPSSYIDEHPDFQGFRVLRREGADWPSGTNTVDLTGTALAPDLYQLDATVSYGKKYTYRVVAGDCYYQRHLFGMLSSAEIAANAPGDANSLSSAPGDNWSYNEIPGLALGYFDRAQVTGDVETTLTAAIDDSATTIDVVASAAFTRKKFTIGTEYIECAGSTGTSFTGCLRAQEGSVAIAHNIGDVVRSYPPSPPRAAISGDLTLDPATFRHNIVKVGVHNTSLDTLTLKGLTFDWSNPYAWFKTLIYNVGVGQVTPYDATPPLANAASGTTVTLTPAVNVYDRNFTPDPLVSLSFFRQDGGLDNTVDMREAELDLLWMYRNNGTGIETCSMHWLLPDPGIVVPLGPVVSGVSQSKPDAGTNAWAVPGTMNNPLDAVVVGSGSTVRVSAYALDRSGKGMKAVTLFSKVDCRGTGCPTTAPAVAGSYPTCAPYTPVSMTNVSGTNLWQANIAAASPGANDGKTIWYFIVAEDNEGNFDRDPEPDAGAYQYFQQPPDPCLNIPEMPTLVGTTNGSSSVSLDWSSSWTTPPTPATYKNVGGTDCVDLKEFEVLYKLGATPWRSLTPGPPTGPDRLSSTTKTYQHTFTTKTTNLTGNPAAGDVTIAATTPRAKGFLASGKIKIGSEVISYAAIDATDTAFTGCTRGVDSTGATGHTTGTAVTQDLLDLESNSYQIKVYDTCSAATGPKTNTSAIYTDGLCSPSCNLSVVSNMGVVSPATAFNPGDSFTVTLFACDKKDNGKPDAIYLQDCSLANCDIDPIGPIAETGDTGYFTATVTTSDNGGVCGTGGGGNFVLYVNAAGDTISIGGYVDAANLPGSWGTTCQTSFSCGTATTIAVVPPTTVNICDNAAPTAPAAPATVAKAVVGLCAACPNKNPPPGCNSQTTKLTWDAVAAPAAPYRMYYEVLYCTHNNNATCTPNTFLVTSTTSTTADVGGVGALRSSNFTYGVRAVYDIDLGACPTKTSNPIRGTMTTVEDPCP